MTEEVKSEGVETEVVENSEEETELETNTVPVEPEGDETEGDENSEEENFVEYTTQDIINKAADIAAKYPAHAGKSPRQHGIDIAAAIRDMFKK